RALEREWWRRTVTILVRPTEVFEALRDDSPEAASARQEPLTALVFLSGIGMFLSTRTAATFFDDRSFDSLEFLFEAILAGLLVGLSNFWLIGGAVYLGARGAGGERTYRQGRHLTGLATAPFVLSLVAIWPIRTAIFGSDLFRSGGSDSGPGGDVFRVLDGVFLAWTVALLVIGVRALYGWSWGRSLSALALAGVFAFLFAALAV